MELWAVLAEACVPEPDVLDVSTMVAKVEEAGVDFLTYAQEAAERGRVLEVMAAYRAAAPGTFDEATILSRLVEAYDGEMRHLRCFLDLALSPMPMVNMEVEMASRLLKIAKETKSYLSDHLAIVEASR